MSGTSDESLEGEIVDLDADSDAESDRAGDVVVLAVTGGNAYFE